MAKWRNRITDQFKTFTTKVKRKSEMINIPTISGFESTFAKKKKKDQNVVAVLCCPAQQNFIFSGNNIPLRTDSTAPKRLLLQKMPHRCKAKVLLLRTSLKKMLVTI